MCQRKNDGYSSKSPIRINTILSSGVNTVIALWSDTSKSYIPRTDAMAKYPPDFMVSMAWLKESEELLAVRFLIDHEAVELGFWLDLLLS